MNRKLRIGLLLCIAAAMCFLLTGCYMDGDDITTVNTTQGNSLPFDTMAPRDTATPSPSPEIVTVVTQNVFGVPTNTPGTQISPNDWGWDNTPTPDPASALHTTITLVTPTPAGPGNTIAYTTKEPSTNPPIATTKSSVTATPKPAGSLKLGSSGTEVRNVQKRLKELGYLKGSVDGDFGTATQDAVKAFQKNNGLTADGKVGKETLAKLNSKNAKKASASATATKKPSVTTKKATATPKATRTPDLSKDYYLQSGASGAKVRTLQNRLIELGWMDGKADGEFGGATEYAVKAYQKKVKGLYDDGVAGPDTLKSIYSNSAPKGSAVSSIGYTLESGSEGSSVRALQNRLKSLGYLKGTTDGSFGVATEAAVIAFQQTNGLTADGKAGTGTLNRIYSDKAIKANGSAISTDKESGSDSKDISSTGYKTLETGSEGADVRKLQNKLKDLGYYAGTVDGKYGDGTEASVMAFQQRNNLRVDGKAGPATQRRLYGGSATANVTYGTLRKGYTGKDVKNLQYTLYELGYYDGERDGVYGATTEDAVRAFQIANKIKPVDGTAGNKTLQKLYSPTAIAASETSPDYETIRPGDKGETVVELQECLKQAGYLAEITGVYDDDTVNAVKAFQRSVGINPDGVAGSKTLVRLFGY